MSSQKNQHKDPFEIGKRTSWDSNAMGKIFGGEIKQHFCIRLHTTTVFWKKKCLPKGKYDSG